MQAVARMYENGEGTKRDRAQALLWLLLAAQRGNQDALPEARQLRSLMTEKEWKDTEKKLPMYFDKKVVDSILHEAVIRRPLPSRTAAILMMASPGCRA